MAGGEAALSRATETTEDDPSIGVRDLSARGFAANDVLVGIAASGRTPYVLGAVAEARRLGAVTVGICCSPDSELSRAVDFPIAPLVGPEVVAGSTRMKAGTAQKLVLNMLSTGTFIRLGYVYGNLMVNVQPKNEKLVDRARRIVAQAAGVPPERAVELLAESGMSVRTAIVMGKAGITREEAERRLAAAGGHIDRRWRMRMPPYTQGKGSTENMDKFVITGGVALHGEIPTNGSKNSALPALAAALLTDEPVILHRMPRVRDIRTMQRLLVDIGTKVDVEGETVRLHTRADPQPRSALRTGQDDARFEPGAGAAGGALRPRPRLAARRLRHRRAAHQPSHFRTGAVGRDASIRRTATSRPRRPTGCAAPTVNFDRITVTGTEDLMMAAVLAKGETVLRNAAREPEVVDLAELLIKMGAQDRRRRHAPPSGFRASSELDGAEHTIIADRIEAGTFLIAGAITGGDLTVTGCDPGTSGRACVEAATRRGGRDTAGRHVAARARRPDDLRRVDMTTEEYPGFATDLQAQYMALMTQAEGIAIVVETIFENRFMHAQELARMGANIRLDGKQAIVAGPRELTGAGVIATDLRASASLVLAALVAKGETVIDRVYHIDRGYEKIEAKLAGVGAKIQRVE